MTYKIEGIIEKIESPILCNFAGTIQKYSNGKELAEKTFDRHYIISSIKAEDGMIILKVEERESMPVVDFQSEENIAFF